VAYFSVRSMQFRSIPLSASTPRIGTPASAENASHPAALIMQYELYNIVPFVTSGEWVTNVRPSPPGRAPSHSPPSACRFPRIRSETEQCRHDLLSNNPIYISISPSR